MAYKKGDYAKYHKSKRMKVERAARNKNRKKAERKGKVRKGDGRHIDHKDGNPKKQLRDRGYTNSFTATTIRRCSKELTYNTHLKSSW